MRKCNNCGGDLLSDSAKQHPEQKYCSRKCYFAVQFPNRRVKAICHTCSREFWYYASRGAVKFCNNKCYFATPKSEEFKQKISDAFRGEKHPNWKGGVMKGRKDRNLAIYKNWRNAVFARDKYTCQFCGIKNSKGLGRTVQLEADHIKSWTLHPELRYDVDNGRTLCKDCHTQRTAQQHKERMSYAI